MLNEDVNFINFESNISDTTIKELNRAGNVSKEISYSSLFEQANLIAHELRRLGLQNRRILLAMHNGIGFIEAIAACLIARCTAVPVSLPRTKSQSDRLKRIVEDARIEFALTDSKNVFEVLDSALQGTVATLDGLKKGLVAKPTYQFDEVSTAAFVQYTSGSTSDPKGVVVSHENLIANTALIAKNIDYQDKDVLVSWLPMFHDMGLVGFVYLSIRYKPDLVLLDPLSFIQKPVRWLKAVSDYKGTVTAGPNFSFEAVINRADDRDLTGIDLRTLRCLLNGAEPILPATLRRMSEKLKPFGLAEDSIMPCYGLAEATLMVASKPVGTPYIIEANPECQLGSEVVASGCINEDVKVEIVDPKSLMKLANNRVGEVIIAGQGVFRDYLGKENLRSEYWVSVGGRNYFKTGDLGFIKDGNLFITGRMKDLVIIRGRNIYPSDVEACVEPIINSKKPHSIVSFSCNLEGSEKVVVLVELEKPVIQREASRKLISRISEVIVNEIHVNPHVVLCKPHTILKTSSGKLKRSSCKDIYINGGEASIACELMEEQNELAY